jgi:putative ABC transport system permease protein
MTVISRIQLLSTLISVTFAIAVTYLPIAAYESLENELYRWLPSSSVDSIQVSLLPPGLDDSGQMQQGQATEGLRLFRPAFIERTENDDLNLSARPPLFTSQQIAAIRDMSGVQIVTTERGTFEPFVMNGKQFTIVLVSSPDYFEIAGFRVTEGRFSMVTDPSNFVVLGNEARKDLFRNQPAVGQQIISDGWGFGQPMAVVGVLAPASPAYKAIAGFLDNRLYLLDLEDINSEMGSTTPIFISTLWIKPHAGYQSEVIQQLSEYLTGEFGNDADIQITAMNEFARTWGGITLRQLFLLNFGWAVSLAVLAAILNISTITYFLLLQRRFEIGVKRSLGASRQSLMAEYLGRSTLWGLLSSLVGVTLAMPLAPLMSEAVHICPVDCEPVPIQIGLLTSVIGIGLGIGLWWFGTLLPLFIFLRQTPATLLRESSILTNSTKPGRLVSGIGFAGGVIALLIILGMRDGSLAQLDRILGWAGGERAGAFVDWYTRDTKSGEQPASLAVADYDWLRTAFPEVAFGWLGHKGVTAEIEILEASANIDRLRPPVLAFGRWFNPEEESLHSPVAVIGPELAQHLANEQHISQSELLGQSWSSYTIIGVMGDWSALSSMGYYADVAYVPIGARNQNSKFFASSGQIPFFIPENLDFDTVLNDMKRLLNANHPEGPAQVILPAYEISDLLAWRSRLHLFLGLFAGFSLLISSLGVMNIVFIGVVRQWREIGIRRAIGATQRDIARQIVYQTLQVTFTSSLIGSFIGTSTAFFIQYQSGWPITVYVYWLIAVAVVALLAGFVFGGIPALWAATRLPAETLQME